MLDARRSSSQERFWDRAGRRAAALGLTADQVTVAGVVGILGISALYPLWPQPLAFGVAVAVLEESDNLDGAIARCTGTTSRRGAYLDALTDRYKDLAVLIAIAWVHDLWALAFLAGSGALLTSYAKARAAMEAPLGNKDWPDLFERTERIVVVVAGLVAQALLGPGGWLAEVSPLGLEPIAWALLVLAIGAHGTALQRGLRALRRLGELD